MVRKGGAEVRLWMVAMLVGLALSLQSASAFGLPGGRSWGNREKMAFPGVAVFAGALLEVDSLGIPSLTVGLCWTTNYSDEDLGVFAWADSSWKSPVLGGFHDVLLNPEPVLSLTSQRFLPWISSRPSDYKTDLMWSEVTTSEITSPDTVTLTTNQSTEFSGAAAARRHWVVRSDQRPQPNTTFRIRTLYSDTARIWHELPELGVDEDHCTMAPLTDSSAIVVYAGASGLSWAIAEGNGWASSGNLDPREWVAAHPRLRFRPSGGLWLMWTEKLRVHVSSYKDGVWSLGGALTAVHPPGDTFWSGWCEMSRDTAERPVLVWGDLGVGYTHRDVACVAFPTETWWTDGEEVPNSGGAVIPTVARDRNGDVWVAWWLLGQVTTYYTHTYVSATCGAPRFTGSAGTPVVHWTLSGPAPGSFWAVERAAVGGEFVDVARVRADADTELSWMDKSAPAGVPLRYRIRRESVDARYRWWSPEALWDLATGVQVALGGATVEAGHVRLVWQVRGGALGALTLERRTAETAWQAIATLAPDGTGRVIYEDSAVAPGMRYGYRLTVPRGGILSAEAWVEVPLAQRLRLMGFRPNPVGRGGRILFSLADGSPAKLEAFDVRGRRLMAAQVGGMGAGSHTIDLPASGLRPGVYLLRLTQGGKAMTARGVVME